MRAAAASHTNILQLVASPGLFVCGSWIYMWILDHDPGSSAGRGRNFLGRARPRRPRPPQKMEPCELLPNPASDANN